MVVGDLLKSDAKRGGTPLLSLWRLAKSFHGYLVNMCTGDDQDLDIVSRVGAIGTGLSNRKDTLYVVLWYICRNVACDFLALF